MPSERRCGSGLRRAPRPASSRPGRRTLPSSRVVFLGYGTFYGPRRFLGGRLFLLFGGGLGVHRWVDGTLAELPGQLQAVVGLRLEFFCVVDAVDRAYLDAERAVHAARVVDHEPYGEGLGLARTVGVALGLLDGDAMVWADPHALQARDAAVHVDREHPAAPLREFALVLGVLAGDLLPEEVLQGDAHPLHYSLSYLRHRNLLDNKHSSGRNEQPDQGDRNQYLPAQVHELVHPETGYAPPDPLEGKHNERRLDTEPDPIEMPEVQERQRRLPAPQEQRYGDGRHDRHRGELGGLYEGPRHPGVLDHETAHDLALTLWEVERHPLHLGDARDVERQEHRELGQKVPGPDGIPLRSYHVGE